MVALLVATVLVIVNDVWLAVLWAIHYLRGHVVPDNWLIALMTVEGVMIYGVFVLVFHP